MQAFKSVSALAFALAISLNAGVSHAGTIRTLADYGSAAHSEAAVRKVVIKPTTKWVNVTNGEAITFVVGEQSFTFHFNTYANTSSLSLSAIAPVDISVPDIRVYVTQHFDN